MNEIQFRCQECKCMMQIRLLNGSLVCASCGSRKLKQVPEEEVPLQDHCIYCDRHAGRRYCAPLQETSTARNGGLTTLA